jgi:dolichyl-phosphate beta-glucosyltransferase
MPPSLSVVIPAYNEEHRLGPTVTRIREHLAARGGDCEVIVVDDGSTDRTAAIARASGARLIEQDRNRGKGAAVRAGVLAARRDRVLFSDADLATPIEELAKLEAALDGGADVAIASRAMPDSDIRTRQHPIRELMGRTFNVMVRTLLLGGIRDTQCGFKLFRRDVGHDLFGRATVDGFAFDVEVLWLARGHYRVVEVPVVWHHVEESKVSPGTDAIRMFADVVRLRLRHRRR